MAIYKIFYFTMALFISFSTALEDKLVNTPKCQFGKSFRKQVDVVPLNGACLRDMVVILSKNVHKLSNDELGISKFQGMLDKLDFFDSNAVLNSKLNDLAKNLNEKLKKYTDLLKESNNIIQPILSKQGEDIYSNGQKIDGNSREIDICTKINDALAVNLRNQDWKNLHIMPVSQPGTMCGPPSLAHIIGSLLLSQCNRRKNVILLVEHNAAFMSEEDVSLAQNTAKRIIYMLTDTDHVTVVGLAGRGSVLCPEQGLPRATDIHKITLDRHIDSMTRTVSNKTFNIDLAKIVTNVTGELVILHVTNSVKDNSGLNSFIEKMNRDNLKIHYRTIMIQSNAVDVKDKLMNDSYIILPTQHVFGYEIAKLFSGLTCNNEDKKPYYLSEPYFEPYSKTMMVSIGQITNTALLSYDLRLQDFVEDVTYFDPGPHQLHALLVDKRGMLWMHRDFPRMEMIVEQPLKVYIHDLENFQEDVLVNNGMTEQAEGVIELHTLLGSTKQVHWRHLAYSDLIVCLVVTRTNEDFIRVPILKIPPPLSPSLLHHRLDLALTSNIRRDSLCVYNDNRVATLEASVVYLSPWCFKSPAEQAKLMQTMPAVTVQSYMAYIKDETRLLTNPGMQENVKAEVAMLAQILPYFKERHENSILNKYVIQRYVTSVSSGTLEIYPGLVLDSDLDPKRRSWYIKALQQPDRLIITPPYLDAGGAGYVVTLSQVVHEGRSVGLHSSSDPVLAVMAIDVTLGYLFSLLEELFPVCEITNIKCFLMDDKGYLVYHPSLLQPSSKIEQQHLMMKELLVANDILNHDFFVRKKVCASHMDGTSQRYYQFNTSLNEVLTNIVHGEHCVMYQLAVVPGTNVFLGIVNITCNITKAFCPCSTMDRSCLNCKRVDQTDCECPCECPLYKNECSTEDSKSSELQPCSAPQEQGSGLASPWVPPSLPSLKPCRPYSCADFTRRKDCIGIAGCQWCELSSDGEISLKKPYCADAAVCFNGVFGSPIPYGDGIFNSQSTEDILAGDWPTVGPVAGGILAIVLILSMSLFCYRLRNVQTGLEHECLHNHNSPDTLRMTHLDCDTEPVDIEREQKGNMDSALLRDVIAPISPYRVSTNYRRPAGCESDHGYSTMTPHDDSEQQNFSEPLLVLSGDVISSSVSSSSVPILDSPATSTSTAGTVIGAGSSPTTEITSNNKIIAAVDVHQHMETNYC